MASLLSPPHPLFRPPIAHPQPRIYEDVPAAVARVATTAPPYPFPVPAPVAVQSKSVLRMQGLISSPPRLLARHSWPAASPSWAQRFLQEQRFRGPSVGVHCAHLLFVSSPALQWLLIPPLSRLCNHPLTSSLLPASHSFSVGAPLRETGVRSIVPSRAKSPCSHIAGAMPASTRKLTSRQAATMSTPLAIALQIQVIGP
jgi:hypothetical protein